MEKSSVFLDMSINNIIVLITSDDWRIRIIGEYLECRLRIDRLVKAMSLLTDHEMAGATKKTLENQRDAMIEYAKILEARIQSLFITNYKEKFEDADRMCLAYSTTLMNHGLEGEGGDNVDR